MFLILFQRKLMRGMTSIAQIVDVCQFYERSASGEKSASKFSPILKVVLATASAPVKIRIRRRLTRLHQTAPATSPALERMWREVVFSIPQAQGALPYIARITRDAADAFGNIQRCRSALSDQAESRHAGLLMERRDTALHRLDDIIDECNAVGADLLDIQRGVVRFATQINGRRASLIWRLGEPVSGAWKSLLESA